MGQGESRGDESERQAVRFLGLLRMAARSLSLVLGVNVVPVIMK